LINFILFILFSVAAVRYTLLAASPHIIAENCAKIDLSSVTDIGEFLANFYRISDYSIKFNMSKCLSLYPKSVFCHPNPPYMNKAVAAFASYGAKDFSCILYFSISILLSITIVNI
jgi:hypothetical protein